MASHESRTAESLPQQTVKTLWVFEPVFSAVFRDQKILRLITVMALLQLVGGLTGMPGWKCPVYAAFAVLCPGCGLTAAMMLIVRGEWQAAFATHMFAPFFLTGIIVLVLLSLLPLRFYRPAVMRLAFLERHTGLAAMVMIGMIVYWGVRFFGIIGSSATP